MAETTIQIRTLHGASTAVGWAGSHTVTIDRPEAAGGRGLGYGGGQLLLLSVGACYCNNLFHAADERGVTIRSVEIEVSGTWTEEPMVSEGIVISAKVAADAGEAEILDLMSQANDASTVGNSLRQGIPVTLGPVTAVAAKPAP